MNKKNMLIIFLFATVLFVPQPTRPMRQYGLANAINKATKYVADKTSQAIATTKETYTNIKEIFSDMKEELAIANAAFKDWKTQLQQTKGNLKKITNDFANNTPNIALALSKKLYC
jgi:gas vesicle protein